MFSPLLAGPRYLMKGVTILVQPEVRRFVLLPLLINLILFMGGSWWAMSYLNGWITGWVASFPVWLQWLESILWLLAFITTLMALFFSLTVVGTVVAAPFNSLLATAVENYCTQQRQIALGRLATYQVPNRRLLQELHHLLLEELRKLRYYLVRAVPLLLLMLIPGINLIAAPLWFLFTAWMMALTYLAYPLDNHQIPFQLQRDWIRRQRLASFSLGLSILLLSMVPVVNFLMMPLAVIAATVFWFEQLADPMEVRRGEEN